MTNKEKLRETIKKRTQNYGKTEFINEILKLEILNILMEKRHKKIINWIEDEIKKINKRMKKGDEFLEGTQANYVMIRNLDGYKKALHNVLKEIDKLEKR